MASKENAAKSTIRIISVLNAYYRRITKIMRIACVLGVLFLRRMTKVHAARWGNPEDLMGPAIFLASDASNFVNGHVLYVDGGILAYIGKQPK